MFTAIRRYYPNGIEGEEMHITIKEYATIDKAIAYAHRYARGVNFAGVQVESEKGETLYEITSDFEVVDNRKPRVINFL